MDIELLKSLEADADKLRSPWSNLGELGVDGLSSFLKTFGEQITLGTSHQRKSFSFLTVASWCSCSYLFFYCYALGLQFWFSLISVLRISFSKNKQCQKDQIGKALGK